MKKAQIKDFLKKNKKQVLIAIGAIILIYIVVRLFKKLFRTSKASVEAMTGQTITPGLNFDNLARRMFTAWISTWGTDEDEVYSILNQMNTQADWEYLQSCYENYWDSMSMVEKLIHTTAGLGLSGVLLADFRRELDSSELQRCRSILQAKGINPGF